MIPAHLLEWVVAYIDQRQAQHPWLEERIEPFFSTKELNIVRAFAQALFYDGADQPSAPRLDWLEEELQDMFGSYTGIMRAVARAMPWLIELSPLIARQRATTFSQLDLYSRVAILEHIEQSDDPLLGGVLALLKMLCTLIYLEHPEVMQELGITDRYTYDLEDKHPIFTAQRA